MKVKTSQGDVIIDIPKKHTKVGIKHSGGLDSTIIAYMLALYKKNERPEIDLIPITLTQSTKPFQWMYANMSQRKITELTGVEFGKHYFRATETQHVNQEATKFMNYLIDNNIVDSWFYGITLNPPLDAFPDQSGRNVDRDDLATQTPSVDIGNRATSWRPFANIDKKGVCEVYESLNVLDELFPLTHSCENVNADTMMQLDLSRHCGLSCCWWCQERLWGFGKLDGLSVEQIKPSRS